MKKIYETPTTDLVALNAIDVIAASENADDVAGDIFDVLDQGE